jgi:4-amino-4-deoxy-L-arabinose transferase-like glycosyltransferase
MAGLKLRLPRARPIPGAGRQPSWLGAAGREIGRALLAIGGWPLLFWIVLVAGAVATRPPLAPLETATLSVVWQAWVPGFVQPGVIDRPPLLVWIIHLLWSIFGISEPLARLVTPAFSLAALLGTERLARLLWPDRKPLAAAAAIVLVGTGGFAAYLGLTLAAIPPLFFFVLGLVGLARAWRGNPSRGWTLYGTALLFGCLSGGWGFLIALLPPALLAPLWADRSPVRWTRWYAWLVGSAAIALGLIFFWMWAGGMDAVVALGREWTRAGGVWHRASFWSLALLPFVLFPWFWWRTLWRSAPAALGRGAEPGIRFAAVAVAAGLAAALATGNGQADALLPVLPPLALLIARAVADEEQPREFHALLPGLLALFVGLIAFLFNIVPVAHLDAVWRTVIDEDSGAPIWLGGISLVPGLMLLGGGYFVAQITPRGTRAALIQLALLPALLVTSLNLEFIFSIRDFFDLRPIADRIHMLQNEGRPVAFFGPYKGQFDFAGRLQEPLTVLRRTQDALFWAAANPDGVVVSTFQGSVTRIPPHALYIGRAGDTLGALWPAPMVLETGGGVLAARF